MQFKYAKDKSYISYDFYNWTAIDTGLTNALRAVTFSGAKVIVSGENGLVLYSDDELNFYQATLSPSTTDWLEGVAVGSLYYNSALTSVAITVGDNGLIYRCSNGTNRSKITTTTTNNLTGLASSSNCIVAVGSKGTILYSTSGNSWTSVSSGTTNWSTSATLEIEDSSGLLYFYQYDYITNRPAMEFFRTKLIY